MLTMGRNRELRAHLSSNAGRALLSYIAFAAVLIIALDGLAHTRRIEHLFTDSFISQNDKEASKVAVLEAQFALIPIDHEDISRGVYRNRYWQDDRFYEPGGPVFVYDVGEGDASVQVERMLQRNTSFMGQLLREFHGLGLLWEHRYYGESQPIRLNSSSGSEQLQFLTLSQSLADLPYFARNFSLRQYPEADLRPPSSPWIMIGCSYSGARAAWSRAEYPETFYAAFAESTVTHLEVEVEGYSTEVRNSLMKHGYTNCTRDLHSVLDYVDSRLGNSETSAAIKRQFFGPGAEVNSDHDFASALFTMFEYFKSWGIFEGKPSIAALCDYLEFNPNLQEAAPADGLSALYDAKFVNDRLASWPHLVAHVNKRFNTTCERNGTLQRECNLARTNSTEDSFMLPWIWQQCTELGLFISEPLGPNSLSSRYATLDHELDACRELFGMNSSTILANVTAAVERINTKFNGRAMRPSNVFWTTGEYDPYRKCSPLSRNQVDGPDAPVSLSQNISTCKVSTGADKLFGWMIPEKGHCEVIGKNSTEAMQARRMFADALHEWLECF